MHRIRSKWWCGFCFSLVVIPFPALAVQEGADSADDTQLRVLVWNVLHGANDVERGAEKALEIIRRENPDLVLMQESYDIDGERGLLGPWIAQQLGWNSFQGFSTHLCVLTPWKIEKTYEHAVWHGIGAQIEDSTGRSFVAYSIWIDYRASIGGYLQDHPEATDEELLACETTKSGRLDQAKAIVKHLKSKGHFEAGLPLLVGGDFNCPSHLDWTPDTEMAVRYRRALPLPVSKLMADSGFVDTYRAIHPNPVQRPGITWTPMFRGSVEKPATLDRIDRLYLHNPRSGARLKPILANVLPKQWAPLDQPVRQHAFPSDHGAVVIDLEWQPSREGER
ncbi:MAG: endonuclease/exonuclease/phosphatase family protein [Mariniblastus sp.]|nr:endonuclease/exonuclease/phosphatase family protein [Mariniblastus sp.]